MWTVLMSVNMTWESFSQPFSAFYDHIKGINRSGREMKRTLCHLITDSLTKQIIISNIMKNTRKRMTFLIIEDQRDNF